MDNKADPSLKLVAYERVSTARQGRSGLGLEAQRNAIDNFASERDATVLARFTEVESGGKSDRPELQKARQLARRHVARLVRLSQCLVAMARGAARMVRPSPPSQALTGGRALASPRPMAPPPLSAPPRRPPR